MYAHAVSSKTSKFVNSESGSHRVLIQIVSLPMTLRDL